MTVEMTDGNQYQPRRRGFFGRFLRALFTIILVLVVLAGLAGAGWLGYQELRRSFHVVNGRIDRQGEQLSRLQSRLDEQAGEVESLRQSIAGYDEALASLRTSLGEDIDRQDEMLVTLAGQVEAALSSAEAMTQTIGLLNEGQAALQQDVIGYSSEMDALGGEFDQLQGEVLALQASDIARAEELAAFDVELTAADVGGLRQAVLVYRVWGFVTRARLRLAEQNLGLAASDIQLAQATLADLLEGSVPVAGREATVELLRQVEQRLLLAAESLPAAPETTIADLDIAWQDLDTILAALLGPVPAPTPTP